MAEKLWKLAIGGDVSAIKYLMDRIDGRIPWNPGESLSDREPGVYIKEYVTVSPEDWPAPPTRNSTIRDREPDRL